ncbi:hypothetical protein BIFANG_03381 [Bifidobacterium angulatum DSM 20098 = JCM 7096]|uniref:Uncharacterized protein n=1 Tax=Bifidobacterium angulatum DSM 20098 = JCM 7096 TaxID=518635 RepID=C4FGB3_9BIFI|nr:hypothetical protein BIFANG_03381 [Bifidobacterium angulatum DSM 20098 = JCM 7096]
MTAIAIIRAFLLCHMQLLCAMRNHMSAWSAEPQSTGFVSSAS